MAEKLFRIAIEIATEATKNDRRGNYRQAYQQYLQAAEILYKCIQLTKNPQLKETYFERARKYVNRCKQIKAALAKPQRSRLTPRVSESKMAGKTTFMSWNRRGHRRDTTCRNGRGASASIGLSSIDAVFWKSEILYLTYRYDFITYTLI